VNSEHRDETTDDIAAAKRDEAILAAYEDAKLRHVRSILDIDELKLRHTYAQRREAINEEIAALRAVANDRRDAAAKAVLAYATCVPHRVRRAGIEPPSLWERLRSLGGVGALYREAARATRDLDEVNGLVRDRRDRLDGIERETRRSIELREEAVRKKLQTPEGQAAVHADPAVQAAYEKAKAVLAERAAYDERVRSGGVEPEEARDREFARRGYAPARVPLIGAAIARVERYGPLEYYILRDLAKREYALAGDPRLEPLRELVFDVTQGADGYDAVVRYVTPDSPMSVLDHLNVTFGAAEAGELYAEHRAALRAERPAAARTEPRDDDEAALVAILVLLAEAAATRLPAGG
jgi:hypothetical protein